MCSHLTTRSSLALRVQPFLGVFGQGPKGPSCARRKAPIGCLFSSRNKKKINAMTFYWSYKGSDQSLSEMQYFCGLFSKSQGILIFMPSHQGLILIHFYNVTASELCALLCWMIWNYQWPPFKEATSSAF